MRDARDGSVCKEYKCLKTKANDSKVCETFEETIVAEADFDEPEMERICERTSQNGEKCEQYMCKQKDSKDVNNCLEYTLRAVIKKPGEEKKEVVEETTSPVVQMLEKAQKEK